MKAPMTIVPLVALLCATSAYGVVVAPMVSPDPMTPMLPMMPMVSPEPMGLMPGPILPMASPGPMDPLTLDPSPPPLATVGTNQTWTNAFYRGTTNGFGATPMTFVNGLWRIKVNFGNSSSERFKVTRFEDWSESYPINDFYISQGAGMYEITFDDTTREIIARKMDGTVDIQFQCDQAITFVGQSVYAIGNVTELGSWNLAGAVLLSSASYPSWRKTIPIKIGQNVAWKCVKRSETNPTANVVYEPGFNNIFTSNVPTTVFGIF